MPWKQPVVTHTADPRVDQLMTRMTAMEHKQGEVDLRMGQVEGSIEQLGVSMSSQFTEVLRSIAALSHTTAERGAGT